MLTKHVNCNQTAALSLQPLPLWGLPQSRVVLRAVCRCSREPHVCPSCQVSRPTSHFQPSDNAGQPDRDAAGVHYPRCPCSGSVPSAATSFPLFSGKRKAYKRPQEKTKKTYFGTISDRHRDEASHLLGFVRDSRCDLSISLRAAPRGTHVIRLNQQHSKTTCF